MKIEARKIKGRDDLYGWSEGKTWWDYSHPRYASGPDKDGWGHFITARIYIGHPSDQPSRRYYLAIDEGCRWEGHDRVWEPVWFEALTLEEAMDFCEGGMRRRGILP